MDVLDVLCSDMELGEYGEVLRVGDFVRRPGVHRRSTWFGTGLDEIDCWFDRYAGVVGGGRPIVIAGEIDAIASIYTRLSKQSDGTWAARTGFASLERLTSTAETRRPLRRIAWKTNPQPSPSTHGMWGTPDRQEGDESLWGWRITLADAVVEPAEPVS